MLLLLHEHHVYRCIINFIVSHWHTHTHTHTPIQACTHAQMHRHTHQGKNHSLSTTDNTQNSSNGSTLTMSQTLASNSTTTQRIEFNIPFMGNYNCSDDICSQFLKSAGKYSCNSLPQNIEKLQRINGSCHFMDGSNRAPVGLISFPGSGNTWVRGLLEQATGICTGEI